jgi:hypothetical protein
VGEASGKSQKPGKDSELETEYSIINKPQDWPSQGSQAAWGTREAASHPPAGFSGHCPNGQWDRVLGDELQTPEERRSEYFR